MATDIDVKNFTTHNDAKDLTFNQLLGINNEGVIAGYFGSGAQGHANKGYTLTPPYGQGNFHNENFPGSVQTQVTGLNNNDLTVGFWSNMNNANMVNNNFGFVEHDGHFTNVVDPLGKNAAPGGMTIEQLLGVNDHNQAVGFWTDGNGNAHGFTYDVKSGSFGEVDVAGFASTTTTAINNEGHIAGFASNGGADTSFIKEGNKYEWLTGPKGAVSVQALGINNEDQVVGSYTDANNLTHGFLFDDKSQTYKTIDDPNQQNVVGGGTVLNGINDKGQVVGFFMDKQNNTEGLQVTVSIHHS
jgi:probable HAF family extracellular repeat protein